MTATDLDQQLAELGSAADAYAARYQFIPDLTWPDGIRIAINFTCDFDAMLLRRLLDEPPMQLAKGEFGGRVGIWRLVELFDAHGVKATVFTPGRICELYPEALRTVIKSGHEIADHMWEHRVPKEPALEEDHLAKTVGALERVAGAVQPAHAADIAPRCSGNTGTSTAPRDQPTSGRITSSTRAKATASSTCPCTTSSTTRCTSTSTSTGSAAIRRLSGSLIRSGFVTFGGRRFASNTMSAAISTSACTRSSPAERCASRCSTG